MKRKTENSSTPSSKNWQQTLKKKNLSHTIWRQIILETLDSSKKPMSIMEIYRAIKGPKPHFSTIYRNLKRLVDAKLADVVETRDRSSQYIISEAYTAHTHKLICTECGNIFFVKTEECGLDKFEKSVEKELGFKTEHHSVNLYGICSECQPTISKS